MSASGGSADFGGLRVISLESRRADQMEQTIRRHGGIPFVAPSVREIPFEQQNGVFEWADKLFAGAFEMVVLMTGAGLAILRSTLAERYPEQRLAEAMRKAYLVSRGPKPTAILHEMGVTPDFVVPEPNTWKEVVAVVAARPERRISVQEYGAANPEFLAALEELGAEVTAIAVYRYSLPEDQAPLREAVRRIVQGECDVVLFTTSIQLTHLLEVAVRMGCAEQVLRSMAGDCAIGSVGPVMDAALAAQGLVPDIRPAHPKMAVLVRTAAESAASVLSRKRAR